MKMFKKKKCSICGKKYEGYGNNALPVNSGRCCDYCNENVVVPVRIFQHQKRKRVKKMQRLKIRNDVNIKELEKFGYMDWDKENCDLIYFKFVPVNKMAILIHSDRRIDYTLPIGSFIKERDIKLETFVKDLEEAGIIEKVEE